MTQELQSHRSIKTWFVLIALLAATVMLIGAGKMTGLVDGFAAKRGIGVAFGLMMILTGNVIPKLVLPVGTEGQGAAGALAAERLVAWTFVLTGFVCTALWLFAPADHVMLVSSALGLCTFAVAGLYWLIQTSARSGRYDDQVPLRARFGILLLLHTLAWCFAIFGADAIWGDTVAQWLAMVFVVVNGLLGIPMTRALLRRGE